MPQLELFVMAGCPYCAKVLRYMDAHGISMPVRDVYANPAAMRRLSEVGGKVQAPCLFVDGAPLYESDDIVAYLAKLFG